MPTVRSPRAGSLQYWPRRKAKKQTPRIRNLPKVKEPKLSCFAGYKVGMVTVSYKDSKKTSPTVNLEVARPATVVECPPLKILSVRFYKNTPYGLRLQTEVLNTKLDKDVARKISVPKKTKEQDIAKAVEKFDELRLLVYTQPRLTTLEKKRPEVFEVTVGGSQEEQLNYAKEHMAKEITVSDVLKAGEFVDVHAVSKGKGFQGPVKRFGIGLRSHKSEKARRNAVLAPEGDAKVQYFAHQAGQTGYHLRTDYNKYIIKVLDNAKEMEHFKHYGELNNPCVLLYGTVPGSVKRLIKLSKAIRPNKKLAMQVPEVKIR
ncbi:50S ribosomal protein L3 [Candidatus Woesearchaeota archaeon]|nr:50S ribosomal protein L3 [Candidatus Woesearchaeota archaeon]